MSRIDLNTVETPSPRMITTLAPYAIYGVKAHLVLSAVAPNGVREDIRVTQDINPERFGFWAEYPVRSIRGIVNDELHINYHAHDVSAYDGIREVMDELTEEGYTDIHYSDDGILLMLTESAVRRLVRKGVMKLKGA